MLHIRVRCVVLTLLVALAVGTLGVAGAPPARAAAFPADAVARTLTYTEQQLAATDARLDPPAYPVRTNPDGSWFTAPAHDWTSGFYPGALWQTYERTRNPMWLSRARAWQAGIESRKTDTSSHDIGFQIFNTFGRDHLATGDARAKDVVMTAANSLAQRYNPTVRMFRSWDAANDARRYQVIMDNMMNLEMMFWASQNGGRAEWADMARNHALRTSQDFFRGDGGSWHVVNYDQTTGAVASKYTHQGYSNDSTWSRGQAWAVYGFTMSYRFTQDARLLDTARRSADYFIANLPADKVPYWDFNLPSTTGQPRDSSAAAIAADGLLELSGFETDTVRKQKYSDAARDILASLSSSAYLSQGTPNQAILLHGTQNRPSGSSDTGIMFGDYYFVEALNRYQRIVGTPPAPTPDFVPVTPARLLETRSGSTTVDNQSNGIGPFTSGQTRQLTVAGRGGVPATGARVAVLTVTALAPSSASYITMYPSGQARPTVSNLNLTAGRSVTGTVVVPIGPDGTVSIFNQAGSTNMVVDLIGWYRDSAPVVTGVPRRLQDTRAGAEYPTFDGQGAGGGAVGLGQTRDLQIDGRAFTAAPAGSSVLVNVTAANPTGPTFVTVWPTGQARPTASNLNLVAGQVLPNPVLVPVGAGGRISMYNLNGNVDLVVDLQAVVPGGASTRSLPPARLLDTRSGSPTVDQQQSGTGALAAGQTRSLPVAGRGGVPATGAGAVIVNITGVQPSAATTVTAWPTGGVRPADPNLTVAQGEIRPGLAVVPVGPDGAIQLYNQAGRHDLVVDVLGWISAT